MNAELTPEERALLNEQTIHGEGPAREVGPVTLDVLTFTRRRLLQRAAAHMMRVGAPDSEQLHTYILMLALPLAEAQKAARSVEELEAAMDSFFSKNFGMVVPAEYLSQARVCFDSDMKAIEAAMVSVVAKPSASTGEPPPPNS
jgi:hypothetical protein